jgi:hypothetical protein
VGLKEINDKIIEKSQNNESYLKFYLTNMDSIGIDFVKNFIINNGYRVKLIEYNPSTTDLFDTPFESYLIIEW